jgi:hypothetical protein
MLIKMKPLVLVAHPDDEILWFSSILLRDSPDVICVTSGRDSLDSQIRKEAFVKGMRMLGINDYFFLDYPDTESRLDVDHLKKDLVQLDPSKYDVVFTHSLSGDTHNQIHHQDVSYAAHQVFSTVLSNAWNQHPTLVNLLTPEELAIKKYILGTFYYREYDLLSDAYEISAIEKFSKFSKEASEIFYYGIANFGDNHELLGSKYPDFWGFRNSPYEIERHQMIIKLVNKSEPKKILEFGSCEGILTERLNEIAPTTCVEKSKFYKTLLKKKSFDVVDNPNQSDYDLIITAAFLEYLDSPERFLRDIKSEKIIIDVILESGLDNRIKDIMGQWNLVSDEIVRPRWEKMYWGNKKEELDVYRLGAHGYLYEKK